MIISKKIEGLDIILKEELNFSLDDKEKYIEDFKKLKEKGVISKDDEFEDATWTVTISKVTKVLNFRINEMLFKRMTKGKKIKLSFEGFNIALRRYTLEMIYNHSAIGTITSFLSYTKKFLEDNNLPLEKSIEWLEENGGYCDCEVLDNIEDKILDIE